MHPTCYSSEAPLEPILGLPILEEEASKLSEYRLLPVAACGEHVLKTEYHLLVFSPFLPKSSGAG